MSLVRLIYVSTVGKGFNIENILETSKANNALIDITGVLYFNREFVIQVLEGERCAVNNLFQVISQDKRHTKVVIVDYTDIVSQDFGDWDMGYIAETAETKRMLSQYSDNEAFEPYQLNGANAHNFLRHFYYKTPK